uniref:protein kinase C n=1 Tax=Ciona savignyi TaxID=51511 RepID=H2ZEW5_CIOSA
RSTPSITEESYTPDPLLDIQFYFQIGFHREQVVVKRSELSLVALKELAVAVLEKQFPQAQICLRLAQQIHLFQHQPNHDNILKVMKSSDEMKDGALIEVVLSAEFGGDNMKIRPHTLSVHSYRSPAFCDYCGEMLWGIVRQGLRCDGCGQNYHKRCAYKIPNDCTLVRKRKASVSASVNTWNGSTLSLQDSLCTMDDLIFDITPALYLYPSTQRSGRTYSCRPLWMERSLAIRVPHAFQVHSYTRPTVCMQCKKLLRGFFKQGVQCKCKFNCHKRCKNDVPANCPEEETKSSETDADDIVDSDDGMDTSDPFDPPTPSAPVEEDESTENSMAVESRTFGEAHSYCGPASLYISSSDAPNIPLMRVVQSIKQTKKRSSTVLKEGWLIHFTNKDSVRRRHYWRLDSKSITLYRSETGANYFKEIELSDILSILMVTRLLPGEPLHFFKILTSGLELLPLPCVHKLHYAIICAKSNLDWSENVVDWHTQVYQALTPVDRKQDSTSGVKRKVSVMISLTKDPEDSKATDISQIYQVFPDEVLGSGQFGTVYGGKHRKRGFDVAIKVVDKLRFQHKEESQLRHEVQILEWLDHPGIVKLFNMFETPEQVFVVMEKLRGDMLEMILSSEKGRLPERITKF